MKDVKKDGSKTYFPTLLNGTESSECVLLRQNLYEETWASVESRIQVRWLTPPIMPLIDHLLLDYPRWRKWEDFDRSYHLSESMPFCEVRGILCAVQEEKTNVAKAPMRRSQLVWLEQDKISPLKSSYLASWQTVFAVKLMPLWLSSVQGMLVMSRPSWRSWSAMLQIKITMTRTSDYRLQGKM